MKKNYRNLLITIVLLIVVLAGAYLLYQSAMTRSAGPSNSYVPQLALPAADGVSSMQGDGLGAVSATSSSVAASGSERKDVSEPGDVPSLPAMSDGNTAASESMPEAATGVAEDVGTEDLTVDPSVIEEAQGVGVAEEPVSAPKVPDLPLTSLDGTETSFDAVRAGRPVVLNFWATWCPSCKRELPILQKVWEELGTDAAFILLSTPDGQRETVATVAEYVKKNGIQAPVYVDDGLFAYLFGANAIPTTIFINADGTVAKGYMGYIPEETMFQEIRNLLAQGR